MRHATLLVALALVAGACTTSTQARDLSLAEELDDVAGAVDDAVTALFDTLTQEYDDRAQLYQRLLDLRLPSTLAIQLDKAQRVDPPPGTEAELDRYVAFLSELLLDSEELDRAIATEDPVATAIATVTIDASSGALAVALPTATCATLAPTPTRDLCRHAGLDGYETSLDREIRRFVAAFRPVFRVPDTFGDVVRGRVLATLQEEAAQVLDVTESRVAALDPGNAYIRVHAILLDYFPAAKAAWGRYEADVNGSDPLIYSAIVESLDAERAATLDRLEAEYPLIRAAFADTGIDDILAIWFDPPPSDTP